MKMETRFPENMKATLKSIREMRGYKQDEAAKMIGIAKKLRARKIISGYSGTSKNRRDV